MKMVIRFGKNDVIDTKELQELVNSQNEQSDEQSPDKQSPAE